MFDIFIHLVKQKWKRDAERKKKRGREGKKRREYKENVKKKQKENVENKKKGIENFRLISSSKSIHLSMLVNLAKNGG